MAAVKQREDELRAAIARVEAGKAPAVQLPPRVDPESDRIANRAAALAERERAVAAREAALSSAAAHRAGGSANGDPALAEREEALDARARQLDARLAQLEERERAVDERERVPQDPDAARLAEIDARLDELRAAEEAFLRTRRELADHSDAIAAREQLLAQRERDLDEREDGWGGPDVRELEARLRKLETQRTALRPDAGVQRRLPQARAGRHAPASLGLKPTELSQRNPTSRWLNGECSPTKRGEFDETRRSCWSERPLSQSRAAAPRSPPRRAARRRRRARRSSTTSRSSSGSTPAKLSSALEKALENRVDAAVAAGRLTKEQGEALKKRIEAEDYPLLGGFGPGLGHRGGPGMHGFGHLDAAATYLGTTEAELRTQLEGGKTLADVAKAKGKSVDGLVSALVADEKKELDAAVKAGRITQAQADAFLADAKQRFTDLVNGTLSEKTHGRFGGPPGTLRLGPHRHGTTF